MPTPQKSHISTVRAEIRCCDPAAAQTKDEKAVRCMLETQRLGEKDQWIFGKPEMPMRLGRSYGFFGADSTRFQIKNHLWPVSHDREMSFSNAKLLC